MLLPFAATACEMRSRFCTYTTLNAIVCITSSVHPSIWDGGPEHAAVCQRVYAACLICHCKCVFQGTMRGVNSGRWPLEKKLHSIERRRTEIVKNLLEGMKRKCTRQTKIFRHFLMALCLNYILKKNCADFEFVGAYTNDYAIGASNGRNFIYILYPHACLPLYHVFSIPLVK